MIKSKARLAVHLLLAIFTVGVLVLPLGKLSAQQNPGQGLEISPPLFDLKADPGQVLTEQIKLRNVTAFTMVARVQYDDFVANGEEGNPKLLIDSNETSPFSIKSWLSSIPNITLAPDEQKTVNLTITVPKDASPGGHYGVIRFTGTPPEADETSVSLSASIGSLVLVNVSGNVKEDAKIAEIFTSDKNGKRRGLFEYGPIVNTIRVENTGNVHVQPTGTVRITNMFGKEVASFPFNQNKGNVLPSSIRKFEYTMDKKLLFGHYKIQADLVFGSDNKIISATKSFWVIPYKLILIVLAIIVLIIFLIRGYNRLILKRARRKEDGGGKKKSKK